MPKIPPELGHNVVPMPTVAVQNNVPAGERPNNQGAAIAAAGSRDDPRMQEALRRVEAFLAVEDAQARAALVALAESLISYDWVRRA
ncbi:MAG: hypothetical protein ABI830_07240 [Pseudolabrys sp.]